MSFSRAYPGDPFQIGATEFNTVKASAEDYLRRAFSRNNAGIGKNIGFDGIVTIKNASGANRNQFEILEITSIAIAPADNEPLFKARPLFVCSLPTSGAKKLVVLQRPIANNAFGPAMIQGMSFAKVNMVNADDKYAGPKENDPTKLESSSSGPFLILYAEPGTGDRRSAVLFPVGEPVTIAKFDGTRTGKRYTGHIVKSDGTNGDSVQWMFLDDPGDVDLIEANTRVIVHKAPKWIGDDAAFGAEGTYGKKYFADQRKKAESVARVVQVTSGSGSTYNGTFADGVSTGSISFTLNGYAGSETIFAAGRYVLVFKVGSSWYATFISGTYFD
jgi:hypothetical protein